VLLQRTRLAYVHLHNLLTDAKRDRGARVYGYVCVWLTEEFLVLYLQAGEVVTATASSDGVHFRAIAIGDALAMVPGAAEFGEICFHEAEDEQLATMYWTQLGAPDPWPSPIAPGDPQGVLACLHSTVYDGTVEVRSDFGVNYGVVRHGRIVRGFFVDKGVGAADARLGALLLHRGMHAPRLFRVPPPLPAQAPPALVTAYRDLMTALVHRLVAAGAEGAPAMAEHARAQLEPSHPPLERFARAQLVRRDPVTDTPLLSAAIGAWIGALLGAAPYTEGTPAQLVAELTRDRRHMFAAAGLYDALPWRVEW
jgi:hypothetical protein